LESELLAWLRENLPASPRLAVGFGDDAAVLAELDQGRVVVTTDMLTDGVDFHLDQIDPRQAGHKALGANLSDLAAMAARPVAAFVSLVLPRKGAGKRSALELAIELYRGMLPLAERFEAVIAGGDTNSWDGPLAISVTALGETTSRGPLTRSGAQLGDQLLVTGQLGGSILGRHLEVEPRVREALLLNERYELHAGIDISDGLGLDASRLAEASGVGAALTLDAVPLAEAARRLSDQDGRPALEHALSDGEDFELLLAVPAGDAERMLREQPVDVPLTRIGEMIAEKGLWQIDAAGSRLPLAPEGFQHRGET
jgi:thiamine-monophosphate kinase